MKVQVIYRRAGLSLDISQEYWNVKNIRAAKRRLRKTGIVGNAQIHDCESKHTCYYKPK